jgi:acetoin utilization protein AcuB
MKAKDVMTVQVTAFTPGTPVRDAYLKMVELGVRHAPIVNRGRLCGLVSDRDLLVDSRRTHGRIQFPKKTVRDVMTHVPLFTARRKTSVSETAQLMVDEKIDALPVVAAGDRLVGLITASDLLRLLTDLRDRAHRRPFRPLTKSARYRR